MATLKFKTDIKCSGCEAKVTPFLNEEEGIQNWKVDTTVPEKLLTVETSELSAEEVSAIVKEAGFNATAL